MTEPLIIKAWLASPLAGDAPMLDAILEYHAFTHNIDGCEALSAGYCGQLHKHDPVTYDTLGCVPLERHTFPGGETCYCVSSPIINCVSETTDHFATRMDYNELKGRVRRQDVARLRQITGPYMPSFEPHRSRTVRAVAWYARGDAEKLRKWLCHIDAVGGLRASGYGIVDAWTVDPAPDYWMTANGVLMRPVPRSAFQETPKGARPYFGAIKPPYWHPQRQMEIWKPC